MGDRRPQFAGALDGRLRDVARRRLSPDDALYGAGCGDGDRGRRGTVALPRSCRTGWRAECVPKVRGKPQGSYRARPADVTGKYMAQWKDRYRLGLWLRRLDRAAGGVGLLPQSPSRAASRSASAMSSMVLALKKGSSGCAGHVQVAR